jgi:hypothetical protein
MYIVGLDSPHCHHIASKLVACIQAILVLELNTSRGHLIIIAAASA